MITVQDIEKALRQPPPAASSDFDFAPDLRVSHQKMRPASVLIALQEQPQGLEVILTRRASHLRNHPGQVAFPGGKVEMNDDGFWQAALREAHEEIGLNHAIKLGELQAHESITGFEISPQIGFVESGFNPVPDPSEVEEAFNVPLAYLMDPANMQLHQREWGGVLRGYLAIPFGPHYIWGASARMIKNLADRLKSK